MSPDEFEGPDHSQRVVDWVQFQTECNQTQNQNQKVTPAAHDPHMTSTCMVSNGVIHTHN